jgi:Ni,Fe-hydrogenase I cytochrome b subunit
LAHSCWRTLRLFLFVARKPEISMVYNSIRK